MELVFTSAQKLSASHIEMACAGMLLQLTMKAPLKTLPENLHWHYKLAKQPGVLEITLLIGENKLIVACKKNRAGEWINKATERLKLDLKLKAV